MNISTRHSWPGRVLQPLLIVATIAGTYPLQAAQVIGPGITTKMAAGLGITQSRGAPATVHNPANLSTARGRELYYEVDVTQFDYMYISNQDEHEIARISFLAPPSYVGFASRRPGGRLSWGGMIIPTGMGTKMKLKGVPIQMGTNVDVFDTVMVQSGYQIVLGGSYQPGKTFGLGVSLTHSNESLKVEAAQNGNTILRMSQKGTFSWLLLGARFRLPGNRLRAGLVYRPETLKKYKGTLEQGGQAASFKPVGYLPAMIAAGVEFRTGRLAFFAEAHLEQWTGGRTKKKSGFSSETKGTDYLDTTLMGAGAHYKRSKNHKFTVAASMIGANLGNGLIGENEDGFDQVEVTGGGQFGDFDSIGRTVFAGGWHYLRKDNEFRVLLSWLKGNALVPDESPGAGYYQLNILVAGIGGVYRF